MNAEQALFQSIRARLPDDYPFRRFLDSLIGWDVLPVMIDGALIGAVMIRGNEIHIGCEKPMRASPRALIKSFLLPIIKKHGSAVTSVMHDNRRGLIFCKRLGFEVIDSIDGAYRLRCERANYV